jgi:hypothetical protein
LERKQLEIETRIEEEMKEKAELELIEEAKRSALLREKRKIENAFRLRSEAFRVVYKEYSSKTKLFFICVFILIPFFISALWSLDVESLPWGYDRTCTPYVIFHWCFPYEYMNWYIHPLTFLFVCIVNVFWISYLCTLSVRIKKSNWKFVEWCDSKFSLDVRTDTLQQSEFKHKSNIAMLRFKYYDIGVKREKRWLVSMELLMQLNTAAIMDVYATEEITWERIRYAAKTNQSVNIDKSLVLDGQRVYQQTCLVALDMWRSMIMDVAPMNFPKSQ